MSESWSPGMEDEEKLRDKLTNEVKVLKKILNEERERRTNLEKYVAVLQQQLREAGITPKDPELPKSGHRPLTPGSTSYSIPRSATFTARSLQQLQQEKEQLKNNNNNNNHNNNINTNPGVPTLRHCQSANNVPQLSMTNVSSSVTHSGLISPHGHSSTNTNNDGNNASPQISRSHRRVSSLGQGKGGTASPTSPTSPTSSPTGIGGMEFMLHPALTAERMLAGVRMWEVESCMCFSGKNCVDWLVEQNLSRVEALAVADKMLGMGLFKQVASSPGASQPQPQEGSRFAFLDDELAYYTPTTTIIPKG